MTYHDQSQYNKYQTLAYPASDIRKRQNHDLTDSKIVVTLVASSVY